MPIQIAVVGPGRLGCALARRWHEAGLAFLGFAGRDRARTAAALAFVGAGTALGLDDLRNAQVIVLAVGDDAVAPLADQLASRRLVRSCALVFHLAGALGRAVLDQVAQACGARTAAMHPLVPVPDAASGYAALPGRFALCEAGDRGGRLLALLAARAGLRAIPVRAPIDREAWHAACTLAANGATALVAVAGRTMAAALRVDGPAADTFAADLASAATALCRERGPVAALSGPVLRGDHQRVESHLRVLTAAADGSAAIYRGLMREALALASARGLPAVAAARIEALLAEDVDA